ncbi:MAG TPA: hypothetical protein VGD52_08485 [Pseudoduganella sp.]
MKFSKLISASAVSMALAACGGGGSDSNSATTTPPVQTSPVSVVFSGTAAVGAPLEGSVTVKDSKGATKVAQIGANGAYSVDVTGMTGPFVFRASGSANGLAYTVHSIATSADAAGKINITQLTDLIAANVGGQVAANYFDQFEKNGNAAAATAAAIDAEAAKLKEKLQAVLGALGVEANADLLRTPFTPLSSPLDKALDAIHVSVDNTTAVATISTLASASAITDDLKQKAAAETNPAKLAADNISTAITDGPLIKKMLADLMAQFANGTPAVSALTQFTTSDFLSDDLNAQNYFDWMANVTTPVGSTITDIELHRIDYSDPSKITAWISFAVRSKEGVVLERIVDWQVRKSASDGVWRLHGNQRGHEIRAYAMMSKMVNANGTCYRTGLSFEFLNRDYRNDTTTGAVIDHVVVTGPGLPAAGLRYNWVDGSSRTGSVGNDTYYVMTSDCQGVASPLGDDGVAGISDNAAYVMTPFDASNAKLSFASGSINGTYVLKIPRRPLTLAETKASMAFPVASEQTLTALASFTSGKFAATGSNANPGTAAWVRLTVDTQRTGPTGWDATVLPTTAGAFSTSIDLYGGRENDVFLSRSLRIESPDAFRRIMATEYIK